MKRNDLDFVSRSSLLLLLSITCQGLLAQSTYSLEVQKRIEEIENNLKPSVRIVGQDYKDWTMAGRMKAQNVNGVGIAVIHNYKIEWVKVYGWADVNEKKPVTCTTVFQAASISKSLNAVGLLKLVQNSKADMVSDINLFLKTWKFPYDSLSNNKKISISNLLSHTAGLSTQSFPGYSKKAPLPTITEILQGKQPANTEPVRSIFEPNLRYKYSGGGSMIAQLIVMDISQQPYESYMKENVFVPIGMMNSFYSPGNSAGMVTMASGYKDNGAEVEGKYHFYPELAAAGLWTTPTDLAKFVIEILLSYKGRSNKIISKEMTRQMLTPYVDATAGLGALILKTGNSIYFQHNGANEGFTCRYIGDVITGNGAVVMTNSDNGSILNEIINSVATTYKWDNFYQPIIKQIKQVSPAILDTYIGNYTYNQFKLQIVRKQDGLWLTGPVNWKLYFTSDIDFFFNEDPSDYAFVKDSAGKITGFDKNGSGFANRSF